MNKKKNRMAVRQEVQKSVIRDEQNRRIQFAATNPINEVLKNLHTTLRGLDEDAISVSRAKFGSNKVTHEKEEVPYQAACRCLHQPLYRHSVLLGAGFRHDRYGVSALSFWAASGGF